MRIGVNALYLIPGEVGGTEIYLRQLLAALARVGSADEFVVFTNAECGEGILPTASNCVQVAAPVRARVRFARIAWEQTALPLSLLRSGVDVLLNAGFTAPILAPCPQVTVFHDLRYKRHPEYCTWFELPVYRFLLYWAARESTRIIADSEATAADLRKYHPFTEGKLAVVPLGVDKQFFDIAERRQPERLILAVSTLHPHKNLTRLLQAFDMFRRSHLGFRLVVCGLHGLVSKQMQELRDSLNLAEVVSFPGWIPRNDVYDLYSRAWAFVCPSLFEGFGLPLVEAMAAGIPTACSAIEPFISIAAGSTVLFDPNSVAQIADALSRITGDLELRSRLSAAERTRAKDFSWEATAAATLRTLEAARNGVSAG